MNLMIILSDIKTTLIALKAIFLRGELSALKD